MSKTVKLHQSDNIVIALEDDQGVPRGHKMSLIDIDIGQPVVKYGQTIGFASQRILTGEHVHSHNLEYRDFERSVQSLPEASVLGLPEGVSRTFYGYRRSDGRIGTRNYVAIVVSVNCSATAASRIASHFEFSGELDDYADVDGVIALTHHHGCGTAGRGNEGFDMLQRTIMNYADHPNIGGVLMLGLGCEVNQISSLREFGVSADKIVHAMTIQEVGGTRKTIQAGIDAIRDMLPALDAQRRTEQPVSELVLGMECGGSDGFSGMTANPALGAASDILVRSGGTSIFGETPEIYGGEHLLAARAAEAAVAAKLMERISWWREYVRADGSSIDNNPTPGNKAGGLTTILEKSLGAIAKGGTAPLNDVLHYGERFRKRGLNFMDTPGYDPVNATGLVAGGANLMAFTTGRGSAFGCKPVPCLKLATNSELYRHMHDDMDIDCGVVIDQGVGIEQLGAEIFEHLVRVASGKHTKSEELGYGDQEFVPWRINSVI